MAILSVSTAQTGLVGTIPNLAFIDTNNTYAEVTTAGYLNEIVQFRGVIFSNLQMALVSTIASPGASPVLQWLQISHVGSNWSLVDTEGQSTQPFSNTGLKVYNSAGTYYMTYRPSSTTFDNNRTFNVDIGNADRTLTMTGDAALDQDVRSTSSPTFLNPQVETLVVKPDGLTDTCTIRFLTTYTDNRNFSIYTGDEDRVFVLQADTDITPYSASFLGSEDYTEARSALLFAGGLSPIFADGLSSNVFTFSASVASGDAVAASINLPANPTGYIVSAVPFTDELQVTFSAPPGAFVQVGWFRVRTV